jgi:hypothetical protein
MTLGSAPTAWSESGTTSRPRIIEFGLGTGYVLPGTKFSCIRDFRNESEADDKALGTPSCSLEEPSVEATSVYLSMVQEAVRSIERASLFVNSDPKSCFPGSCSVFLLSFYDCRSGNGVSPQSGSVGR